MQRATPWFVGPAIHGARAAQLLSRSRAHFRERARHGLQTPTEHQKAVGALGNQTHLTGCVTTSQTPYEQQKMPEIRLSPSFPPFTAPLKEVNCS